MSLIFEALKKLEREKQVPSSGFAVVPHVAWPARRVGRRGFWLVAGLLFLGLAALVVRHRVAGAPAVSQTASTHAVPDSAPPPPARASAPAARITMPPASRPLPPASLPVAPPATEAAALAAPRPTPQTAAPTPPPLRLQAISRKDGAPVAMLNDRLVREGDRVGGVLVVRIGTTEVEVEVDGKRRVLKF